MADDAALLTLMRAIGSGDVDEAARLLDAAPELARTSLRTGATREDPTPYRLDRNGHYIYAGDTALHAAAAVHLPGIAQALVDRGADVGATNRRGAQPLHYAADGQPGSAVWDPDGQVAVIELLVAAGADPDATDKSGVAPIHRAVRTRCAAAVEALLDGGADPGQANGSGSTPMQLADMTTGRGGSGSPEAREQQRLIIDLLRERGARP